MVVIRTLLIFIFLLPLVVFAQKEEKSKKYQIDELEVDILNSYYQQDGDHSAVEGGEGTQYLTDFVNSIVVNLTLDSIHTIGLDASFDTYSSASTDMIDWSVSGPSHSDVRTYANLHYARILKNGNSFSIGGGFSNEWDVLSVSVNAGWQKSFDNDNHVIGIDASYLHDTWQLIYPVEMLAHLEEPGNGLDNTIRHTVGVNASYSAVINKKMQLQFVYNLTLQNGILSTPFHRVYFDTTGTNLQLIDGNEIFGNIKRTPLNTLKDIERLPDSKIKHAFGFRSSNYISNFMILRTFYRYYFDSFGINAHTVSVEMPIKPNRFLSFYPFYRYHTQTASDYFAPFLQHTGNEEFYTSDYDLSALSSHKYGIGVKFSPPLGIATFNKKDTKYRSNTFKSIELRFGKYVRSDGLNGFIISSGLSFSF